MAHRKPALVSEMVGGEPYEYYPLGEHIVAAPGVCGGRPTFKYTRIDVRHAISLLSGGWTVEAVAQAYEIPVTAVQEALELAMQALNETKAARMGKIARISGEQVSYYQARDAQVHVLPLP
jgi:uncharacterized protein (DUF433 family)